MGRARGKSLRAMANERTNFSERDPMGNGAIQDDGSTTPITLLADLLDEAIALDTQAREVFLQQLYARDPARANELRELIAILPDAEPREFADRVERGESDPFAGEPAIGEKIGGCTLEAVLGRGGIGTVFAATQDSPTRPVAVKILRMAHARASHLRRFRTEALALGRLVHPALARIYASGTTMRDGAEVPYIVMERIEGATSIVEWARAPRRTRREIASCMAEICDGMQHGHNRGVIHRDLKPSNVLVSPDGRPHVIDFGIARLVGAVGSDASETLAGALIGTPAYMAPEQFELAPAEIDSRLDIHAVGVLLYEALVGRRPYEIPRHLYFDAASIMRATHPAAPHLADSTIPRDLSAIVMKAMSKDREQRYASMSELADDLRAFVDGRGVRARAESRSERLLRAMRRNPAWTTAVVVSFVALTAAVVISVTALNAARADRDQARTDLATIDEERGLIPLDGLTYADLTLIKPALVGGMIRRLVDDSASAALYEGDGNMMAGAISPDGRKWVVGGDATSVGIFDLVTNACVNLSPRDYRSMVAAGFSYDASRAFVSTTSGDLIEVFASGESRLTVHAGFGIRGILPSKDNDRLLLMGDTQVATLRLSTGALHALNVSAGYSLGGGAWHGDDAAPAYGVIGDRTVAKFSVPVDAAPVRDQHFAVDADSCRSVAVTRDGSVLAVGTDNGAVLLCDPVTGATRRELSVRHAVWSLAFSRDGARVFVGDRAGTIHTFVVADGREEQSHSTYSSEPAWAVGQCADGRLIANLGRYIATFETGPRWSDTPEQLPSPPLELRAINARTVRAACQDGHVRDLDLGVGQWRLHPHSSTGVTTTAALSQDGGVVAMLRGESIVLTELSNGSTTEIPLGAAGPDPSPRLAWNEDGTLLAMAGWGSLRVYGRAGELRAQLPLGRILSARVSWYAPERFVLLVNFQEVHDITLKGQELHAAEYSVGGSSATELIRSRGRWIAIGLNGIVRVTYPGPATRLAIDQDGYEHLLVRHRDHASCGEISPDGSIVATGGADGTVRLWSMKDGARLTTFTMHDDQRVRRLCWLPDGTGIVSVGIHGEVRLMDSIPIADRLLADWKPSAVLGSTGGASDDPAAGAAASAEESPAAPDQPIAP